MLVLLLSVRLYLLLEGDGGRKACPPSVSGPEKAFPEKVEAKLGHDP